MPKKKAEIKEAEIKEETQIEETSIEAFTRIANDTLILIKYYTTVNKADVIIETGNKTLAGTAILKEV